MVTALDANMIAKSDEQQLDYATSQNRVLCSFNVSDFFRIHSEYVNSGIAHAGIVVSQHCFFNGLLERGRITRQGLAVLP